MFEDILGPRETPRRVFTSEEYLSLSEDPSPDGVKVGYIFTENRFKKKFMKDGQALYYEVIEVGSKRAVRVIMKTATIRD